MSQTSGPEEFDPATGQFRAIRRAPAAPVAPRRKPAAPRRIAGLSEEGNRYGVFYEAFEHAARSPAGTAAYRVAQVVIALVFILLVYEAVSYRLALMG